MRKRVWQDWRRIGQWIVGLSGLGALFSYATVDNPGWDELVNGGVDTALVVGLAGVYTFFVANGSGRAFFRRFTFSTTVVWHACAYLLLFMVGRMMGYGVTGRPLHEFFEGNFLASVLFAFVICLVINFLLQVNRLVGHNVLVHFVTGTYHTPHEEERIFLFLDLVNSTAIAEQLENKQFHILLNQFFYDLTEAVLETEGTIYKYVGDEIIVSWPWAVGKREGNCVRCVLLMMARLAERAGWYEEKFGLVPQFRAGVHGGTVIAGEIGDVKQEIAYLGDVLNTTARIMGYCKEAGVSWLVSEEVRALVAGEVEMVWEDKGVFRPRGKVQEVGVWALRAKGEG
ncbi:MAG TPA: adenylate/guanylate cyclase domain-containing protein [Anaerolineae bacterium]|nr:adenylate/guanylate cyclase domain-containing protein [Anaerolineae bacterium]